MFEALDSNNDGRVEFAEFVLAFEAAAPATRQDISTSCASDEIENVAPRTEFAEGAISTAVPGSFDQVSAVTRQNCRMPVLLGQTSEAPKASRATPRHVALKRLCQCSADIEASLLAL